MIDSDAARGRADRDSGSDRHHRMPARVPWGPSHRVLLRDTSGKVTRQVPWISKLALARAKPTATRRPQRRRSILPASEQIERATETHYGVYDTLWIVGAHTPARRATGSK